jgi:hypothetical protein
LTPDKDPVSNGCQTASLPTSVQINRDPAKKN